MRTRIDRDGCFAAALRTGGRSLLAAALLGLGLASGALAQPIGALTQLPSTDGCVSNDGTSGDCADGAALSTVADVVMSPDGKHVYATAQDSDAVVAFARSTPSGKLTQLPGLAGCVTQEGSGEPCATAVGLDRPWGLAISPDGRNVYVASYLIPGGNGGAVAVFSRDHVTGVLTQLPGTAGCVSQAGYGDSCTPAVALTQPTAVLVSFDGKNVYVASPSFGAVAVFSRDSLTGALTQLPGQAACVTGSGDGGACAAANVAGAFGLAMSPNGKSLYVTSLGAWNGGISVFSRDLATGALAQLSGVAGCISEDGSGGECAIGVGLHLPTSVEVTGDGRHVYVSASAGDSVAAFKRNTKTGALTQLPGTRACVSSDLAANPACVFAKKLDAAQSVTMSPDGKNLYVASAYSNAIAIFRRNKKSGKLTQLAGAQGCVENDGLGATAICIDGRALKGPNSVVLSPNGKHVYVGVASSNAVASFKRQ